MSRSALAVRAAELTARVGAARFKALPKEEIERHYASIEVIAVDPAAAAEDSGVRRLVAHAVIHHNYRWYTCRRPPSAASPRTSGLRSLCVSTPLVAEAEPGLFLAGEWAALVRRRLNEDLHLGDRFDLRLAGLLQEEPSTQEAPDLGLVYVARLLQPGIGRPPAAGAAISFTGAGELQGMREQFDAPSRILIDNLQSF